MPQFESQASAVASGYATNATVAAPAGLLPGELLILHAYVEQLEVSEGVPVTITPPEGFVALGEFPTSTEHIQATWWKVASASEPGSYTVSWGVGTWYELEIERISGADTTDPIEGYASSSAATGTTSAPVSVTTTGPDRLLLWCAGNYNSYRATDTWTAPAGWTLREGTRTLAVATLAQADPGTVADISGTAVQSGTNTAVVFAIKPPSGTANPPIVDAGPDAAADTGTVFTRTATNTGGAIATHAWTLQSGPVEPSGETEMFSSSFESGDFTAFQSCQWTGRNDDCQTYDGTSDYSAQVVAIDGRPHVARFEVRDGDVPPFGGSERSEVAEAPGAVVFEGDEVWFALDVKFPADFPTPATDWHSIAQLHPTGDFSPTVTLDVGSDDVLYLTNDEPTSEPDRTAIGPIVRDSWVRYIVHFFAATSSATGWAEVYQDGALVLPQHPRATVLDASEHYWKWGIYRSSVHTETSVVYLDDIRVTTGAAAGPGAVLGSAATLNYNVPATTGAYVLRYTGTNADGSDFDELTLTVTEPGGTGDLLPTQITATASAIDPANSVTVTLASTPPADRLVLGVASFNKSAGTIGIPAGMTSRAQRIGANCSGDVAEGTSVSSGTWTSTANYGISAGLFATDISEWAFRGTTTVFSDTDVTTLPVADLGAAPAAGVVYAVLGVDSSWGNTGAFAGTPPVWGGGYEHVGVFQEATENPDDAGGAAFALAKLDVAAGDPTACTVTWSGADQAYLHLVQFDVLAVGDDEPPPVGGVGSVLRDPRIGVDTIAVRTSGTNSIRIDFSTASNLSNPIASASVTPTALGDAHVPIPAGLTPNRTYYFQVYSGAGYIGSIYQFATLPGPAQDNWMFAFSSCRQHGDDVPVLAQALGRGAGMFLHLGDAHYEDINSTNASLYRAADDEQYDQPDLAAALTTIPGAYVWSNHDYCGNLSGVDATGRETVQQVYRERVPHTTLPSTDGGIYHTFATWGDRVRVIVLDTRSFRDEVGDSSPRQLLGTEQLAWLQNLLATTTEPLTFICSAEGWHSDGDDDDWGFYQEERATIAGWIEAADTECVFLCGDMHRAAIGRPADGTPGGVHVWHAGGMRQFDNGIKGGPYSDLASYHNGICGLVELEDTGIAITATFRVARAGTSDWSATDQVVVSVASTTGELNATLPMPTARLTAGVGVPGELAATLPLPTADIDVALVAPATLSASLPLPDATLAAAVSVPGELAATLPLPTASLTGTVTVTGELNATLPMPTGAISAGGETTGELAATLPLPTASLDARVYVAAQLTTALPLPAAELTAETTVVGELSATLPLPVATFAATARVTGELAAVLPLPIASLSDERKHLHGPTLRAGTPTVVRGLRAGEPTVVRGLRAGDLTFAR